MELPDRLVVRTVPVTDPGDLITRLPDPSALAWVRYGEGLVGWGEAARIPVGPGLDRFVRAERQLRTLFADALVDDQVQVPGSGPMAFGSFTFDPRSSGSTLVVPRALLGRRGGHSWVTTFEEPSSDPFTQVRSVVEPSEVRWGDGTQSAPCWQSAVETAVERIRAGQLAKVVLTRDLHASAAEPIDARALLVRLAARFPECFTFSCAGLVGATPELLVRRTSGQVTSLVLAGSVPRSSDSDEDAALGAGLLASAKDVEEHELAVESVRQVLAPLCASLDVASAPSLLALANVQHLATQVSGNLATSRSALEVAAALHPTAAVCGTPTLDALQVIRELEGMDRGRYTGPVGWLDANGDGEWGIALRCAELDGDRARLFAGGGIVADSDPAAEFAEAQVKLRTMQYALEG